VTPLLLHFLSLAIWIIALPWLLVRRLVLRVPRGTHLVIEIDGAVEEIVPARRWWPPIRQRAFSVYALARLVDEISEDSRVAGLIVVLKSMRCGFATVASLRALLTAARSAGKRVTICLPAGGGTKHCYLATAADRIVLGPRAVLSPLGVLASTRYFRGALDRAGLVPEVHAQGRYKTAAEPWERTTMSDAQREQLGAILDHLYRELVQAIRTGRGVDEARAQAMVDSAPYMGEEAVTAGLVDAVAYEDEMAAQVMAADSPATPRRADVYFRSREAGRHPQLQRGTIAVLRVHGPIATAPRWPLERVAVEERVIAAARLARANPDVRGVIVHVDSPGGGAGASDRIHREISALAAIKPVIACMGNVAASGGYYVAVAAHEIVAQPTTITGSIGVISARIIAEPLFARLGIVTQILQRGAHARLLDPTLALDDDEKLVVDREVEGYYRAFVRVVAQGRGRTLEEIESIAQGRVWTGQDAHAKGLVDHLGGFDRAVEALRLRIGLGADRLRVVVVRPPRKPMAWFDLPEKRAARLVAREIDRIVRSMGVDTSWLALEAERVLAWSATAASMRV
jgi:protease-4